MGLRTASVRHPHVEVMAPALTETSKIHFNLPSKEQLENVSPIEIYEGSKCITHQQTYFQVDNSFCGINNECNCKRCANSSFNQLITQRGVNHNIVSNIMSSSSYSDVCERENKMGLQKTVLNFSTVNRQKIKNMEHIFSSNLESVISENDTSCASDLQAQVDEIINDFKSVEGEKMSSTGNEFNSDSEMFSMTGGDLTNNFSPFEKDLLDNVDVMNIEMEDQHNTVDIEKESHTKDLFINIEQKHVEIKRRLDFLRRRAHKLQSRLLGQHMSYEISGIYENVYKIVKKPKDVFEINTSGLVSGEITSEKSNHISSICAKNFIRKLEITSVMQANSISHHKICSKYFGSGSVEYPLLKNISCGTVNIFPWPMDEKNNLNKIGSQLKTQLTISQKQVDSEATESSSGGESCDEMQNYNNPHQQYLSVQKRALWRYSLDRATIAARWTWLQAQIADIEYRIRLHTDLQKQIKSGKGAVVLENPTTSVSATASQATVNGYRGQFPERTTQEYQCARTRPLFNFKKRKLLQISGLHAVSKRAARPSSMKCGCIPLGIPCALCTGRSDPTYPRDSSDTLSRSEKIALLDSSFHPVFSLVEDTSQNLHLEAIMKTPEWQQRSTRMKTAKVLTKLERLEAKSLENTRRIEHRKKYAKLGRNTVVSNFPEKLKRKLRGRRPNKNSINRIHGKRLSEKDEPISTNIFSPDMADDEIEEISNNSNIGLHSFDSPNSSPLFQIQSIACYNNRKHRIDSYDIDNIVIPYSVAASTRVEKLQYKEILTPKWRIADPCYENRFSNKNNGVRDLSDYSDEEDLTEETVIARHDKCEHEEKKRFLSFLKVPTGYGRNRSHKRTDSRAESSGANTPDPMSPHNIDQQDSTNSPITSPPTTPIPLQIDENIPLPSIAVMCRKTMSQSKFPKEKEVKEDNVNSVLDIIEVAPYEKRPFPINDETYEKMLKNMPENHQFATNSRSQDSSDHDETNLFDERIDSPDSESTESAIGDVEEDPNDPEWSDSERPNRERYKR